MEEGGREDDIDDDQGIRGRFVKARSSQPAYVTWTFEHPTFAKAVNVVDRCITSSPTSDGDGTSGGTHGQHVCTYIYIYIYTSTQIDIHHTRTHLY